MASLELEALTDSEIRQKLSELGETKIGPVNFRTRKLYIKKLKKLIEQTHTPLDLKSPDKYDPKYISHKGEMNESCKSPLQRPLQSPKRRKSSVKRVDSASSLNVESNAVSSTKRRRTANGDSRNNEDYESMDVEVADTLGSNKHYSASIHAASASRISETDENQDFGNMVAKKLRKYNNLIQNIIQNEIMSIFIKADSGYYD